MIVKGRSVEEAWDCVLLDGDVVLLDYFYDGR